MFHCETGNHTAAANLKRHLVVVEIRRKEYSNGRVGFETVREMASCQEHLDRVTTPVAK
jgi:hypothetical protein